jgi:hypothetical protein
MHISDGGCVAINITHQSCRETVVMFGEGFEVRFIFVESSGQSAAGRLLHGILLLTNVKELDISFDTASTDNRLWNT